MSNHLYNNNKAYYNMEQNERNKQNNNNFKNQTLLQKTKNSVNDLIKFNDEFQNSSQYPGEQIDEIKIKQLLLPVYDKIYEIKDDLNKFNELNKKNNNNITTKQFNEMNSLHTNIVFNKNLIDDTLNYMKEKIENVHYEQINKEFQEIASMLETLNIEMENMIEDFNNKYEKIIKEKKRQKIAEDLMNGNYNKNPNANKYDLLNNNDNLNIHKNIDDEDDIDYNKYKYDIDELNLEKENLMLKYLEDKQKAINGLPKLVPPNEKVSFKYDIKPPDYNNNNIDNNIKNNNINNINNINNSNNINLNNEDNQDKDKDNNNIINNSINSNKSNKSNNIKNSNNKNNIKQPKENGKKIKNNNKYNGINKANGSSIYDNKNKKPVNYMEDDNNNNPKKEKADLEETMNDFQKKMSMKSNQILIGQPRKNFKPKIINSGPTKADYLRNIQPRSNASKVTYQNFKQQKRPQPYVFNDKYKKKPNNFRIGKYPNEDDEKKLNEFIEQNPQKPIPKKEINYNYIDPNSLDKQIQKIVELNVKKALALHGLDSQRNKNSNNNNNNDELLKILIQKFDDIETAIRETKNENNGIQYQKDINEMLANEIFHKIYSQINSNININVNEKKNEEPQPPQEKNININQENEEIPKNINIFGDNRNIDMNELDKIIPNPRDILNNYDLESATSSYISESIRNKNELKQPGRNIEITKINIKDDRLFYENNRDNNNLDNYNDNSISKGEIRSDSDEDIPPQNKRFFKTANNYYKKNKTGNDLLMLKNYNENLPENYYYNNLNNNINNINNIDNIDNIDELNNINKNKLDIPNINNDININNINNMNNNDILKKYNLYESDEYNKFKNNFQEKMNNNKTQTNFWNNSNPNYNNTYNQFRPIQNNQNMNNTMGSYQLIKINNKDNEELNKKLQLLKIKSKKLSNELNIPRDEEINQNLNNINIINQNNRIQNEDENSGEYSPGEVRTDESY